MALTDTPCFCLQNIGQKLKIKTLMMISLSDYEMMVKYLNKITERHLWGQGKPTACISTNVNRLSAFGYHHPPSDLLALGGSRNLRRKSVAESGNMSR
jgi:hypothetical protein